MRSWRDEMAEEKLFNKINGLLEDTGNEMKIYKLSELKAFIREKENTKLQAYDQIEELYDAFMVGPGMW
jgi:hypothetical protein